MDDRFETFTYVISKIAKLTQKIKNIEMSDKGLKAVHVMCLYQLSKHKNGLTSKEISDLTLEDKAAVSRALSSLKDKKLVTYQAGYNALITLTAEGKKVSDYIEAKSDIALEKCSGDLSDDQRQILYKSLSEILINMEAYYKELSNKKGE